MSIEERSLELFGHEKYLTDPKLFPAGPHFLARLGLSAGDIHAVSKSEPFIYWTKLGNNSQEIRNVLIVENLSFFHTAVSLLEEGNLDYNPELLIYGEGKKIERSLSFFCRQFPKNRPLFWYAGDLDPEGISIYIRLVEKFPEFRFALAVSIYERMLQHSSLANDAIGQINNGTHTELFLEEFSWELKQAMRQLLLKGKRIPQEVLTIETWKRGLS
ncbi:Wadjet anti-phage system protein JetD domain-containing protein [Bacillus testis]|uniref:Wadjet anti-phage system protein JetD domain-containing protein n=1 Tax=Bacillus testis TaxID=1622072 RepID=UPI00067F3EBC|nr:Wadjet anti-phage system protein JetD domain-containing protein [Bacillus testis]